MIKCKLIKLFREIDVGEVKSTGPESKNLISSLNSLFTIFAAAQYSFNPLSKSILDDMSTNLPRSSRFFKGVYTSVSTPEPGIRDTC